MPIPLVKLKALLLYFAQYTNPRYLGIVKLMKLIYFADFLHVKKYALPITYDRYINLDKGPIPSDILNTINSSMAEGENSKLIDSIIIKREAGIDKKSIIPAREITQQDLDLFSQTELEILENVVNRFGNSTTNEIIEASHSESPWIRTIYRQEIPYELAALDKDAEVSAEEIIFATGTVAV